MTNSLQSLVEINKALAHPVRLRIAFLLMGGPLCVCQVTAVVKRAVSTVSAHLAEMKRAGILAEMKDGRWVQYRLLQTGPHVELLESIGRVVEGDPRLKADARVIRELRSVPLDELCQADLDLKKLGRPELERAASAAEEVPS